MLVPKIQSHRQLERLLWWCKLMASWLNPPDLKIEPEIGVWLAIQRGNWDGGNYKCILAALQ